MFQTNRALNVYARTGRLGWLSQEHDLSTMTAALPVLSALVKAVCRLLHACSTSLPLPQCIPKDVQIMWACWVHPQSFSTP